MHVRRWIVAMMVWLGGVAVFTQSQEPPKPPKIEIAITEKGFTPTEATVVPKVPVELVFTRKTDKTCATEVAIPSIKLKKALPLNEAVSIVLTPEDKDITFSCGMNMLRGKLVVKSSAK